MRKTKKALWGASFSVRHIGICQYAKGRDFSIYY